MLRAKLEMPRRWLRHSQGEGAKEKTRGVYLWPLVDREGQKGGRLLVLSLQGPASVPGVVTFTVTFATITLKVVGLLLFYTRKLKKPGKWDTSAKVTRPRGGRAGFRAQRAPASRRPASRADSWQVFREPLGDHLSNSVAGLPSLPPSCLIKISLPTR